MDENYLIDSFVNDIINKKKILILIGSGMSLNTDSEKPNGIRSSNEYAKEFQSLINDINGTKNNRFFFNRLNKSKNKYSDLATKIIEIENSTKPINNIFKKDIIPILNCNNAVSIRNEEPNGFIQNNLNKKEFCKNIILNNGFEYFGKVSKFFNKNTRILTSNFDPFIEIELKKNNVNFINLNYSQNLEIRGDIKLSEDTIIIEHYHGYWLNDTVHDNLKMEDNSKEFQKMLNDGNYDSLYVFGFGCWEDAFTTALYQFLIGRNKNNPNGTSIFWSFYEDKAKIEKQVTDDLFYSKLLKLIIQNEQDILKSSAIFKIDANIFFEKVFKKICEKRITISLINYTKEKVKKYKESGINEIFKGISYKTGKLRKRKRTNSKKNITNYIIGRVNQNKNIVVCSNFGLGKTTILENIFIDYCNNISYESKYPILINLAYLELSDLIIDNKAICKIILRELNIINNSSYCKDYEEEDEYESIIQKYLIEKQIILILDGIDEAIYKDDELDKFRKTIIKFPYSIVTSVRLEFHDFIDNSIEFENWNYEAIEIEEWSESLLIKYLKSINIKTDIEEKILKLKTINKRPLFVYLLKELKDEIVLNLIDNVSSLYYSTILQSVEDDLNKNIFDLQNTDLSLVKKEYLNLLNSIAIAIYLEFQHFKYETNYNTIPKVTFNESNIRLLVSKNRFLDFTTVIKIFENKNKSKIPIIKRAGNDYTFYHKSFFEYMVANGALSKIINENKCSEAWDVYQTDEVSNYFVLEVKRENVINSKEKKDSFYNAFNHEFIELEKLFIHFHLDSIKKYQGRDELNIRNKCHNLSNVLIKYSERLEEVLYYIGKFENFWIESDKRQRFSNYCKFFFYNSRITYKKDEESFPALNPIYYRTSAITLSRIENDNSYVFNYISFLFSDYISEKKLFFYTQINKDTRYYGKEQLEKKSIIAYNQILSIDNEDDIKPLQILKIFSLFISLCYDYDKNEIPKISISKETYSDLSKKFSDLKSHCEKYNFNNFLDMLEGISYILNHISFDVRAVEYDLKQLLINALERRNLFSVDKDIYRIVNSVGDDLDFLEIDYYSGNIVIEAKKSYYKENKNLIRDILLEFYGNDNIDSICIKNNLDFEISSRLKGEEFEVLYEKTFYNTIDCFEFVNLKIIPKDFPKTGFFIDNRNIRKYILDESKDKKILNLCSYTCSLGAIAKKAGAKMTKNVDKEKKYLDIGKQTYNLNFQIKQFNNQEFICEKLSDFFRNNINNDLKYDIIILDLPEIAPIPCNFQNTYTTYLENNMNALKLLDINGVLITSCCSHGFSRKRFDLVIDEILKDDKYELLRDLELDKLFDHPTKNENAFSDYLKIKAIKRIK